ncbi:MAG: PadR family transcriptional regulator [Microbacterium sp.]|uniref:PadR family transcriptional regulator n=1 Tax=Microbacterium sp. TaxID=51671 RepID=UPI001AC45BF8|nr:PadR family transcriptional regulator [Microbacterium sp.]MBN9154256.1 PadR family transcriptional regulator [Microbacterium sp.]MBN9173145.1 PadR family transcriptional regulator [Microbacterium sp.]
MSVKQSLLAILDQGPCYGYQLRTEFDRRTGSTWPLNVGQIYNTLDRLERDGLVTKGDADAQGHIYFEITDAGRAAVRTWLASPVQRAAGTRDELTIKLIVAMTLPGVDAAKVLEDQRSASAARLQALREQSPDAAPDPEDLARSLVGDALRFAAEAEVRWLDHVRGVLASRTPDSVALELATDSPRRGRPASATTPAAERIA